MPESLDLLQYALLVTGIQYLLGEAEILNLPRNLLPNFLWKLVRCPACCGFWLGVGSAAFGYAPVPSPSPIARCLLGGVITLVLTSVGRSLMNVGWVLGDHDAPEGSDGG